MAHDVRFTVPERELGKSDVEFHAYSDGDKIGTLKVRKGAVEWVPANNTYGHKLNWKDFAKVMQEKGKK